MGICEDVSPGTCDVIFIFFLIEVAVAGLGLICACVVPICFALCTVASKTKEEIAEDEARREDLREKSRAVHEMLEKIKRTTEPTSDAVASHFTYLQPPLSSPFSIPRQNERMICTQAMYPLETNHMPFIDHRQF